jgi:hypothetical protein
MGLKVETVPDSRLSILKDLEYINKAKYLLFLDEKKQKSFDRTELAKNPKLTLKCFNSSHTPKTFLNALTADFLNANFVMSGMNQP